MKLKKIKQVNSYWVTNANNNQVTLKVTYKIPTPSFELLKKSIGLKIEKYNNNSLLIAK